MTSVSLPDPVVRRSGPPRVDVPGLERALRERVGGEVRFDAGSRGAYSTDASNYRQVPIGVVIPHSVEDAVAAIAVCREFGAPVVSRGGGTSLAGQTCNVAVVIDWSKYCYNVVSVDPAARKCVVEPGIVLDELNAQLAAHGLMFGPRQATHDHCTLGGMIGNNSCRATARAITPPPPIIPAPIPACLPLRVISSWASFSSSRTRVDTCSDISLISSPVDRSGPPDSWLVSEI